MVSENDQQHKPRGRGCVIAAVAAMLLVGLTMLGLGLYDFYWKRQLRLKVAELRAAGQPATFEEVLARREHIPDGENFAVAFEQAYRLLEPDAPGFKYWDPTLSTGDKLGLRPSSQMLEITRDYLGRKADALRVISEAARLPKCAYRYESGGHPFTMLMLHAGPLRKASYLLLLEAESRASAGDTEGALESLLLGGRLSATLDCEPFAISSLVRHAMDRPWVDTTERLLGLSQWSPKQLRDLGNWAAGEKEELNLEYALRCEVAAYLHPFKMEYLEALDIEMPGPLGGFLLRLWFSVLGRKERDALYFARQYEMGIPLCPLPDREKLREAGKLQQQLMDMAEHHGPTWIDLCGVGAGTIRMQRFFESEVGAKAALDIARAGLAVEQWRLAHGRWPDSLEDLVPELLDAIPEDPFADAGKIRYGKGERGVRIYSVGKDGQDDDGLTQQEAYKRHGEYSGANYDISFRLLNPELRGAEQMSFRDEVLDAEIPLEVLGALGYPEAKLKELDFSDDDLDKLR